MGREWESRLEDQAGGNGSGMPSDGEWDGNSKISRELDGTGISMDGSGLEWDH